MNQRLVFWHLQAEVVEKFMAISLEAPESLTLTWLIPKR
jgi:hypothetical protein